MRASLQCEGGASSTNGAPFQIDDGRRRSSEAPLKDVLPPPLGIRPVTNVRNTKSSYWGAWLKAGFRWPRESVGSVGRGNCSGAGVIARRKPSQIGKT